MWCTTKALLLLLLVMAGVGNCARILGLFPHFGKSHFDFFEPLMKALAHRGHEVVVVSHFPQATPLPNYSDISLRGCLPAEASPVSAVSATASLFFKRFGSTPPMAFMGAAICGYTLSSQAMQELIHSDQQFDLIVYELFNTDCFLGFINKFRAPSVALSSCALLPHTVDRSGNPDHPAYVPVMYEPSSDGMDLAERTLNTAHYVLAKGLTTVLFDWPAQLLARYYFADPFPSWTELKQNTSVILVNTHFSINKARPLVPGVIEVAGLHLPPVKELPQDIQEFMVGAEHGVIYFSMGSLIKADSLSDGRRQALLEAFSELPQRVLWKWDADELPGQPSNVKISKWMPQFDILNHPNVRLYIGHGGQLGVVEAVHCGVPMIGIPMIGDQGSNIRHLEAAGMGLHLSYWGLSKENVLAAIRTILSDPSFKENAERVSRAFRDRPMSPMDTAVYWTEYVLRHRGAPHLRTAAVDLNYFQYLLLDVAAVILVASALAVLVLYKLIVTTLAMLRLNDSKKKKKTM